MESREGLMAAPKNGFTRVELQEVTEYVPSSPTAAAATANSQSFFHWIKDKDTRSVSIRDAKVIPWKGIIALFISLLTTVASAALLYWMQRRRELVPTVGIYKVMQPASWISALMSVNGAALHVALLEGVTIAWWYRATRPSANLDQLHSLWQTGTSSFSAASQIQKLSYVSLATLFVAILPLNSFLLQAAVTTPLTQIQKYSTIPVPMAKVLPKGYSAAWSDNPDDAWGYIDTVSYTSSWSGTFQQVKNIAGSKYASYAYVGAYDQCATGATNCTDTWFQNGTHPSQDYLLGPRYYHNDTASTFTFRSQGAGFNISCEESTYPYNLTYDPAEPVKRAELFYTNVGWNHSEPNTMTVQMWWKSDSACEGDYEYRFCTLKAATVEYEVEMSLNVAKDYRGPYFSLPVNSTWHNDTVIKELPVYDEDSQTPKDPDTQGVTTYGGIALKFANWYDANLTWVFNGSDGYSSYPDGPMANAIDPGYWNSDDAGSPCKVDMSWGLSYVNYFEQLTQKDYQESVEFGPLSYNDVGSPIDLVLNQIRQSMFLASIYQGAGYWSRSYSPDVDESTFARPAQDTDFIQNVNALRTKIVPVYHIRWALWGASVAMTFAVILLILPTFFGFWVLRVKPTLSPVDVARALNAPLVDHDHQNHMHVDALLKEVGRKNIHHDLRLS